jgi:hypothetical protein
VCGFRRRENESVMYKIKSTVNDERDEVNSGNGRVEKCWLGREKHNRIKYESKKQDYDIRV